MKKKIKSSYDIHRRTDRDIKKKVIDIEVTQV